METTLTEAADKLSEVVDKLTSDMPAKSDFERGYLLGMLNALYMLEAMED